MFSRVRPFRRLALTGLAVVAATLTAWTSSSVNSSARISLEDPDDPPVLTLPADITVISADLAGAPVTYKATAEDDNGLNLPVTCSRPSGGVFPLNMTTVTCSATDRRGQTTTGTFAVTVLAVGPITKTRVIDFERFPGPDGVLNTADDSCAQDREVLDTQYEALGVSSFVLSNNERPTIFRYDSTPIQGSHASLTPVSLADRIDRPGDQRTLRDFFVNFSLDVFRVKISALDADEPMTLEAFNVAGELIASARRGAGSDRAVVPIEVRVDGSRGFIRKVRLNLRQGTERCCDGGPEYYDMLEFDPAAQLPVPSTTRHIDFENYPGPDGALGTADDTPTQELDELFTTPGGVATHKYDALGVRFGLLDGRFPAPPSPTVRQSAFVYVPGSPRALDPRSKSDREAGCGERCLKDFEINFTDPVTRVKLAALNADEIVRLRAYNAAGDLVASASRGRGGDRAVHFIEVRVDPCQPLADLIHRAVVDLEESGDPIGPELYDLLEFDPVVTNRAPVASTPPVSTLEDQSVAFVLNATDPDAGDALTFTLISQPAHGTLSGAGADLTYTPDPDYHGPDSFTYKAGDGEADSNVAAVQITVNPVNDAPVARPETYDAREDGTLSVPARGVLDNDTDADEGETGDLRAVLVGPAPPGRFTLNPDGSFTYEPPADFAGDASFNYAADDGHALSASATVVIRVGEVNDAPVADDDSAQTFEDTPVSVSVLANDRDADDALSVAAVTPGSNGSVAINADGSLTYTPNPNFNGTDTFTYTLDDRRGGTATASVVVRVLAVNDAPVAAPDEFQTNEDETLNVPADGVLDNDADIDDETPAAALVGGPSHGRLRLSPDGSFTYEPDPNFNGTDSFTYVARDLSASSAPVTVKLTVKPVNDAPVAANDSYGATEDGILTVGPAQGVLANDDDVEDKAGLSAGLLKCPSHGKLAFNPDGSFTYKPDPDYNGPDSFTYKAKDTDAMSGPATVTITVGEVNDAPSAAPDSRSTDEDTPLAFSADTLRDNDAAGPANEDGQTLSVTSVADKGNAHGAVTLEAGVITYTPAPNYHGPASFEYTVCDDGTTAGQPTPLCSTGVVTLGVASVNDAPAAANHSFGTAEDTPASFLVVTITPDVDGDNVELDGVTQGSHGTVVIASKTTVLYSPALNYNGPDAFTYTVKDGKGATATASVQVTVTPVNDPPVFVPLGPQTVNAGSPLTFTLVATDPDAGDLLTFTSPNLPAGATLTPGGVFNWTPCRRVTSAQITFVVTDSAGASDTTTVNVTVVGVLDQLNQLSAYLDGLGLDNRYYEPIDADLDFAIKHYEPAQPGMTCDGLERFIDGVRQRENAIGADAAARMINAAQALQRALGCGGGPGSGC
ncbi:MAG TPA: Ig-like domain-containing protein [Pyrinomonadaceae bacterium]|jgi:VCBS repeat-containing protein|nr:Ig-like domain-containing protein [Pyrinomonadaceae bacterium]